MTAGSNSTRVGISRLFTRGRLESSSKNSTSSFHATRIYIFFEKESCKVHDESFQPGLNCLHAFFSFFQPGLSCKCAIAFMCVLH